MAPSWGYMVSDQRCWNQSGKSLHLFFCLCAVKHCGVEGEAAPFVDELTKSYYQVSYCFMLFPPHFLSLGLRRLVQLYHVNMCSPTLNITDVYTFLSIYNFHCWLMSFGSTFFAVRNCMLFYPCWHTPVTVCLVYEHNSDPSRGRSLKFGPLLQDGLMNWTNSVWTLFLLNERTRRYYLAVPHCTYTVCLLMAWL